MTTITRDDARHAVSIAWPDGSSGTFPYLWLRENCSSGFHPQTLERTFDLLSVPADVLPEAIDEEGDHLVVAWAGSSHVSRFPLQWLKANRPGRPVDDPAKVPVRLWRDDLTAADLPVGEAAEILGSDAALGEWMAATKQVGLGLVDGLADDPEAGFQVAQRVGFLRETNFGETFEVMSKPDPNNLAYTSHALPLHTDLPNQELPPGFQFLHCIANEAEGGGSVFCDGFAIAEDLRADDPPAFEALANVRIPLRFHDAHYDIRCHDTVIRCAPDNAVEEIRFNAHIAGIFDMPADQMAGYYHAYRAYMASTRSNRYRLTLRLKRGQMVVFDNRRVLHGREAFDPSSGFRRLRGCYVDRGEWDSRMRVLARPNLGHAA